MAKQKYAEKEHLHPVLIFFIAFTIGLILFSGHIENKRIQNLQEEIDSMPHWSCYNETTKGIVKEEYAHSNQIIGFDSFVYGYNYIFLEDEYREGYPLSGFKSVDDLKCVPEEGLCYWEKIEEVCEIR